MILPFQNRILTQSISQASVPKYVFWIKVRSYKLPRGLSCIIIGNRLTEQNSALVETTCHTIAV